MKNHLHRALAWYKTYEQYLIPATLVLGFVIDIITFRSLQLRSALWVLLAHLIVVSTAVVGMNIQKATPEKTGKIRDVLAFIFPFAQQVSLGALLSAAFIFYTFGGAFSASWPVLLVVALLMVSNETFSKSFTTPQLQFPLLYFSLFVVLSITFPLAIGSIHPIWFYLAGLVSFGLLAALIVLLAQKSTEIQKKQRSYFYSMGGVFVFMALFYMLNIIPPVPLSVYESGVYHRIERTRTGYEVQQQNISWMDRLNPGTEIDIAAGERAYVFSAVVAPAKVKTNAVHVWQYKSEGGDWQTVNRVQYPIVGGRKGGYRGFSYITSPQAGLWRVQLETEHGQILGRQRFTVWRTENPVEKQNKTL